MPEASLLDVTELWKFDRVEDAVARGVRGVLDLTLFANAFSGTTESDFWATDNLGWRGSGYAAPPAGWDLLENVGDVITIAVEHHWKKATAAPYGDGSSPETSSAIMASILGESGSRHLDVTYATHPAPPGSPLDAYYGNGVGSSTEWDGTNGFKNAPPFGGSGPYVLFIECVRVNATDVRTRLYFTDTKVNLDYVFAWSPTMTQLVIGGVDGWGVTIGAAVWLRSLTAGERLSFTTIADLDELLAGGDPTQPIDGDGDSFIVFDFPVIRMVQDGAGDTLATSGPQRHTRRLHERVTRRYELVVSLASATEAERLRTVLRACRGGAGAVRWRHPVDDASGSPEDAPLYRLSLSRVNRSRGGVWLSCTVVMESV